MALLCCLAMLGAAPFFIPLSTSIDGSTSPLISYATVAKAPETVGETAVMINAETGEILYDKARDYPEYPASTTKMLTALLALENLELDEVVTVGYSPTEAEGVGMDLLEGEQVTVKDLLYGMLLNSANDAAVALAEKVSGSVGAFAKLMNEKAAELGAYNSYFVTPNGLPNDEHMTTAYDLALIAQEAMKNETFRQIVGTSSYVLQATNMHPEARTIYNTNRMLNSDMTVEINGVIRNVKDERVIGVKTGFTNAAGNCLVVAAEKDGIELIAVILKSTVDGVYADAIQLLDYGFANYTKITICKAGDQVAEASVQGGARKTVALTVREDVTGTAERRSDGTAGKAGFSYTVTTIQLDAPVPEGKVAGSITVYNGQQEAGTYELITMESVDVATFVGTIRNIKAALRGNIKLLLTTILGTTVIILALVYGASMVKTRQKAVKEQAARRTARSQRESSRRRVEMSQNENLYEPGDLDLKPVDDEDNTDIAGEAAEAESETDEAIHSVAEAEEDKPVEEAEAETVTKPEVAIPPRRGFGFGGDYDPFAELAAQVPKGALDDDNNVNKR